MTIEDWIKEFWVWQHSNTGSFYSLLITLYRKADAENKELIGTVWPHVPLVNEMWEEAGNNGDDLFKAFGHPVPSRDN